MPPLRDTARAERFLGVRLTSEELGLLDRWQEAHDRSTRSDAIRALVRAAASVEAPEGDVLPPGLAAELEQVVADGWATNSRDALTLVVTLGVGELARLHAERVPSLGRAARDATERRASRRKADREGRRLLGR